MPRYFFNRIDGTRDIDHEGIELLDLGHAKREAIVFAADTLKDDSHVLWNGGEVRVEVLESDRTLIFAVLISVIEAREELRLIGNAINEIRWKTNSERSPEDDRRSQVLLINQSSAASAWLRCKLERIG